LVRDKEAAQPQLTAGTAGTIRYNDPEEMTSVRGDWDLEFARLRPGPFDTHFKMLSTSRLHFSLGTYGSGILLWGRAPPGVAIIGFALEGAPPSQRGRILEAGDISFTPEGTELAFVAPRSSTYIAIAFDARDFERRAVDWCGHPFSSAASKSPRFRNSAAQLQLAARWTTLLEEGVSDPSRLTDATIARRIEDSAFSALLDAWDPESGGRPDAGRHLVARRAARMIHERVSNPTNPGSLSAELGVPLRTLELGFRESFGTTPRSYIQTLRLHEVRRELCAGGPGNVTDVATRWGFFHLGRFSATYRRLFGESPSATLLRGGRRSFAVSRSL